MFLGQTPTAATVAPQIANLYRTILNREPDPEGLAFWTNYTLTQQRGIVTQQVVNEFIRIAGTKGEGPRAGAGGILPIALLGALYFFLM